MPQGNHAQNFLNLAPNLWSRLVFHLSRMEFLLPRLFRRRPSPFPICGPEERMIELTLINGQRIWSAHPITVYFTHQSPSPHTEPKSITPCYERWSLTFPTQQYVTPRGNLPLERVDRIVQKAPLPAHAGVERTRFPKRYRNHEGPRDNPTHNFDPWEIQRQGTDADRRLSEYPVKPPPQTDPRVPGRRPGRQPPPLRRDFDFGQNSAGLKKINPSRAENKALLLERWNEPPNDPGPIRAVVNANGHVIGAMYHPEGNPRGYERARLAPLDKQGRGELARFNDSEGTLTGRTTWPQRGPDTGSEM